MKAEKREILIVGGGIGGLTLACALQKFGIPCRVFEQAPSLEAKGSGLSLMGNAISALQSIGLDDVVAPLGATLQSFRVLDPGGRPIFQSPLSEVAKELGTRSLCVSRTELQNALNARLAPETLQLGKKCARYVQGQDSVKIEFTDDSSAVGAIAIGADGFHSVIRAKLAGPTPERPVRFAAYLGIVPYEHPLLGDGGVIHFWGQGERFGLVSIGQGRTYWWATLNEDISHNPEQLLAHFEKWHPAVTDTLAFAKEARALMIKTQDRAPISKWIDGRVGLLGDAAHPMLTSVGQGAGIAMEDAVALAVALRDMPDPREALAHYQKERQDRANSFVRLARTVAWYEQFSSPWACALRNGIFRSLPSAFFRAQARSLLHYPGSQ